MVALAMAADLLGNPVSTEEIYEEAVRQGFSLQGEMFSANYMKCLAASFLKKLVVCQKLEGSMEENVSIVVKSLLKNNLILFPYDADKNHGPCQAKGHKAHWALVVGYFIVYKKNCMDSSLTSMLRIQSFTRDSDIDCLYCWNGSKNDLLESELDCLVCNVMNVKVFVHQGKSKHCGIWDLNAMLKSNRNLIELGPDRNTTEYKIPDGGVKDGLCSQAVVICS